MKKNNRYKILSFLVIFTIIFSQSNIIQTKTVNVFASKTITNVDLSPSIVYIRVGQSKNIFDYIQEFSYIDSSGNQKMYNTHDNSTNALRLLTKGISIVTADDSLLSVSESGTITAYKNGAIDPVLNFNLRASNVNIKIIIQDKKPDIENERFDIYDDGESSGKKQVFLEYPDNTTNHQYRVGNGSWLNVDTDFTASVDGVNYYKGMVLLSSVENVSIRCQGIVGGKWSDAFTYSMAEDDDSSETTISDSHAETLPENTYLKPAFIIPSKTKAADDYTLLALSHIAYSPNMESSENIGNFTYKIESLNGLFNAAKDSQEPIWKDRKKNMNITWNDFYNYTIYHWSKLQSWKNKKDGFFGSAFINTNTNEVVISYRGTESNTGEDDAADSDLARGYLGPQFNDAVSFYNEIKKQCNKKGYKLNCLTGHSLGGALANYVSTIYAIKASTFNAAGISYQLFGKLGLNRYDIAISGTNTGMTMLYAAFSGIDNQHFVDHANYHDVIGLSGEHYDAWNKKWINCVDRNTIVQDCYGHDTTCGASLWAHGLQSFFYYDNEKYYLTKTITSPSQINLQVTKTAANEIGYTTCGLIYLGSSKSDIITTASNNCLHTVFSGDGDDIIKILGPQKGPRNTEGNIKLSLDGGNGDDKYYINGNFNTNQPIVVSDLSGKDSIYLNKYANSYSIKAAKDKYYTIEVKNSMGAIITVIIIDKIHPIEYLYFPNKKDPVKLN